MIVPINLRVKNEREWKKMVSNKDFQISKIIVNSILKNLNTENDKINVILVELIDEDQILDICLDKTEFLITLEENLKNFEKNEDYEGCILIKNAIDKLKNKL